MLSVTDLTLPSADLDTIHAFDGYHGCACSCRIRIYQPPQGAVIVATELPENHGTSITNMAEYLAAEVIAAHNVRWPFVWIEHYPADELYPHDFPEHFSRVTFAHPHRPKSVYFHKRRGSLGSPPKWTHITGDDLLRLIGEG